MFKEENIKLKTKLMNYEVKLYFFIRNIFI